MEYFRHHYVPQFYLKGFTADDGTLHVTDKLTRSRDTSTPKKTAWLPEFYRIDVENTDPMGVEKAFSKLEAQCARLLQELLATKKMPTGNAFNTLLNFVATSYTRVPHIRSQTDEFMGGITGTLGKMAFLGLEGAERLRKDPVNASMSDEEMEQLQAFIASGECTITFDKTWHVKMMLHSIDAILPVLAHRQWSLWQVGDGVPDLVCSDSPVALWSGRPGPVGLATPETMLTMPLDRRTLLVSRLEDKPFDGYILDAEDVGGWNLLRAVTSGQIYSSSADWACAGGGSQAFLDGLVAPE
jgi:hypothetical protein